MKPSIEAGIKFVFAAFNPENGLHSLFSFDTLIEAQHELKLVKAALKRDQTADHGAREWRAGHVRDAHCGRERHRPRRG